MIEDLKSSTNWQSLDNRQSSTVKVTRQCGVFSRCTSTGMTPRRSRRDLACLIAANLAICLLSAGIARAEGTIEQAVESALRGNWGRMEEDIRKVNVGRHGFTVDSLSVRRESGMAIATGRLLHRHKHAKSDLIYFTITVTPGWEPIVAVDRIEYRHWANVILNKALEKGFRYVLSKAGPQGLVIGEAGARIIGGGNWYSKLQGDWEGASLTILNAIARRVQQDVGN